MSLETEFSQGVDERRLIFPALAKLYKPLAPYSYAFMRFCTGAILVPHGYAKLFEGGVWRTGGIASMGLWPPLAWSFLVAGVEFFGAIMLAIGLFTRFAVAAIAIEMLVIVFFRQWQYGYLWTPQGLRIPSALGIAGDRHLLPRWRPPLRRSLARPRIVTRTANGVFCRAGLNSAPGYASCECK